MRMSHLLFSSRCTCLSVRVEAQKASLSFYTSRCDSNALDNPRRGAENPCRVSATDLSDHMVYSAQAWPGAYQDVVPDLQNVLISAVSRHEALDMRDSAILLCFLSQTASQW